MRTGQWIVAAMMAFAGPALAGGAPKNTPEREAAGELQVLEERYLDGLFKAKPHHATFMGDHRFDGQLPDYSPEALAAREKELVGQQEALAKIPRDKLTLDGRIDADILADGIALELLYLREIKDWTFDPRLNDSFPYYDPREIVAGRLSDIIHGDFAPEAERRKSVTAQMKALPRFLDQMKAALKAPAKVYCEQGIKANKGRIEFFQTEMKDFEKGDADGEAARAVAVAALEKYQAFLEKDLPPKCTGDWRLGNALYRKKFPLALQTRLSPDEVIKRADAAFASARKELYSVARQLHGKYWPKEPVPGEAADVKTQAAVINRVKGELGKDHPKADDLVAAHARKLDGLRAFIEKHDLVTLPPPAALKVEAMPAFKRGAAAAEYLAPGILEHKPEFRATYYVDPIDPTWPADKVESYLRGQSDYDVELTAAHEAYPGHHTQFFYERKDLNALRATLWNGAMVEGWAVYATTLLTHLGYGGDKNLGYRFEDLVGSLRVAMNVLIDIKLQTGVMTDAEAIKFMVDDAFSEQAVAEKKLRRAQLDSTQLAQYFLGVSEIDELDRDAHKKLGKLFKQRNFNEAMIGHGSIAVKHLRAYLLGPAAAR